MNVPVARPVAFPLFAIHHTPDGPRCACGNVSCGRVGKHPAVPWGELAYGDAVARPEAGAGVGLKTGAHPRGSDVFVVDLDSAEAADAFAERNDGALPKTYTVKTGRGLQLYFVHPGVTVRNSVGELAPGIDVRGDGGFVVASGSPHRSGVRYEDMNKEGPAPAPAWLLEWLRSRSARTTEEEGRLYPGDLTDGPEHAHRVAIYTKYLRETPPCIEGQGGDRRLFEVVQYGAYDLQLPTDEVLELVREHFDPRCVPPWDDALDERVRHKARSAKEESTRPRMEPLPADLGHLIGVGPAPASVEARPPVEAPPQPSASRIVSPFDFVWAPDLAKPVPPVPYVVRHFGIAPGRPTLLAGYGGIGKTFVVECLGLHIAAGAGKCWELPIVGGRFVLFDYEMTLPPTQRRFQRLAIGHGIDLRRCDLGVTSMPNLYLSDAEAETAFCLATEGATLAAIDSLAAATATADEKENEKGIRKYLDLLTRVSTKTGCCFVVLVHERKTSKDEPGGLQRVRGSSAITDAAGAVLSVSSAEGDGVIVVGQTKASLRKSEGDLTLKIEDVWPEGSIGGEGDDAPGLRVQRLEERPANEQSAKLQARIVELLSKGPQETKRRIERALGMRSGGVGHEIDALVVKREIRKLPGVGFVLDNPVIRRERVVQAVAASGRWRSAAELAKAAHVETDVVNEALRDGVICRSSDGLFLIVTR